MCLKRLWCPSTGQHVSLGKVREPLSAQLVARFDRQPWFGTQPAFRVYGGLRFRCAFGGLGSREEMAGTEKMR